VTSSLVFEAAIRVKSAHQMKSCLKTEKKRKYGRKSNFYINLHLHCKRSFRHRIHSLLRRADARGSADIIYRIWRVSL